MAPPPSARMALPARAASKLGAATAARAKLVEDYTLLFRASSLEELWAVAFGRFEETLYDTISPQVQIAENLGFVTGWRYG